MRPAILPPVILMTVMKVLKNKLWKCLWVSKVVEIGILRPSTLSQLILYFVKVVDIGLKIPDTIHQLIAEVVDVCHFLISNLPLLIAEDMLVAVSLGHRRPFTIPL